MALFTDDFTGTNNDLLSSRTGWAIAGSGACAGKINASNQLKIVTTGDDATLGHDHGSDAHYCQIVARSGLVANVTGWPLLVRLTDRNSYWAARFHTIDGVWEIALDGARQTSVSGSVADGDVIRFEVTSGNNFTIYKNGSSVLTHSSANHAGVTKVGIFPAAGGTNDPWLDNWQSGLIGEEAGGASSLIKVRAQLRGINRAMTRGIR